ncbi:MAG: PQQ-binding-like beta-propeller repeat protein [Dehalococcoidia bacterium]|nr:PQQ-binding-like beta-propeller repeat protein [Dehalococcoidia bacterium]
MKNNRFYKLLALGLFPVMLAVASCASAAVPVGWAGVSIGDGGLYTVSGLGQLYSLKAGDNGAISVVWNLPVDSSAKVNVFGNIVVSDGRIYVAGYNGKVYSLDAATGQSIASVELDSDDSQPVVGGIAVDDGRVYVGSSNGCIYALDSITLSRIWKFETGDRIWSTPVVDQGTVFVGSFDKKFYALDAATGAKKWEFAAGGAIKADPVIENGIVYVASFDRHIYALNMTNGDLIWQYPARDSSGPNQWFWATPVIVDGFLFAPCLDSRVYAVDLNNPANALVFDLGDRISANPVEHDGRAIVVTHTGKIFSLAADGNQVLLKELRGVFDGEKPVADAALSVLDGVVYIHTLSHDRVYTMNVATRELHSIKLDSTGGSSQSTTTVTVTQMVTVTQ